MRLWRSAPALGFALAAVLAAGGCGGSRVDSGVSAELLVEEAGLDEAEAQCVIDALTDQLDTSVLIGDEPLSAEQADVVAMAARSCRGAASEPGS